MTVRAALYLRQSKSDDDGIERQRDRTRRLAELRGWSTVREYVDDDVSASKTRGPGTAWAKMLSDASAGNIDVVIGVDLDRLLRSTRDLNTLVDHNLKVVTVDGEIDLTTADGELRASMLASIARFEVRRKGERQTRANAQRAKKGGWTPGARLTGYDVKGVLIQEEADMVKSIFDRFHAGEALAVIAKDLTARGIPTQRGGERWNPSSVRSMLTNARYAGRQIYLGKVVGEEAGWEPIVSGDVFDAVQIRLADPRRKTNTVGTERRYLGAGIYRCGECDAPMKSYARMYGCPRGHLNRSILALDEYVRAVVVERLTGVGAAAAADETESAEVQHLNAVIQDAGARIERFENDYYDGKIDADLFNRIVEKARAEKEAATTERARLLARGPMNDLLDQLDPGQAFLDSTVAIQRTIIDALLIVRLHKWPQGKRGFSPSSVTVEFRR